MLVTTPIILLLLDWPLGRMRKAKGEGQRGPWSVVNGPVVEKIPLLVISAAVAALTSYGNACTHSAADQLPLFTRVGNAFVSYVTYIWKRVKLGRFIRIQKTACQPGANRCRDHFVRDNPCCLHYAQIEALSFALGWVWYIVMLLVHHSSQSSGACRLLHLPSADWIVFDGCLGGCGCWNVQPSTFNLQHSTTEQQTVPLSRMLKVER